MSLRGIEMEKQEKFAHGMCFYKLFLIFVVGSILGSLYEEILYCVNTYLSQGVFAWSLRRGVIYGPFNIIYGFGAAVMSYALVKKRKNWKTVFISGSLIGGIIEYGISYLQQLFTGCVSWDYSDKLLNINGRTTIPYMLFWGFLGLLLVYWIYPQLSKIIEQMPIKIGTILTNILIVFLTLDMAVSFTAVMRQTLRRHNIPAFTIVGRLCDKYYTDDFLSKYYPNAVLK